MRLAHLSFCLLNNSIDHTLRPTTSDMSAALTPVRTPSPLSRATSLSRGEFASSPAASSPNSASSRNERRDDVGELRSFSARVESRHARADSACSTDGCV